MRISNAVKLIALITTALTICLAAACTAAAHNDAKTADDADIITGGGITAEFKEFKRLKSGEQQSTAAGEEMIVTGEMTPGKEVTADGYTYRLMGGRLSVANDSGGEIWASDEAWWVDDFQIGDVTGDGRTDFLYSLWKSYSFGSASPKHLPNDDKSVKNHLFLYTLKGGRAKPVWCSSNLPRPIYEFKLDSNGEKTPASSGMLLLTKEGEYAFDYKETESSSYVYQWENWGFVPVD
jgi:poly-gamma-glutamate synthesis protein (capsule biosynthesis protein)